MAYIRFTDAHPTADFTKEVWINFKMEDPI